MTPPQRIRAGAGQRLQCHEQHPRELLGLDGGRRGLGAGEEQLDERGDDHRLLLERLGDQAAELRRDLELGVISEELHSRREKEKGQFRGGLALLHLLHLH